jgi:hypothetical protein
MGDVLAVLNYLWAAVQDPEHNQGLWLLVTAASGLATALILFAAALVALRQTAILGRVIWTLGNHGSRPWRSATSVRVMERRDPTTISQRGSHSLLKIEAKRVQRRVRNSGQYP